MLRVPDFLRRCVAVLAIAFLAGPGPAWAHRIVAVGDLHGDFAAWRDVARAAGLVDAAGHWAGGAAVLVQTGDVADRGPDSLDILRDLMRLQQEAPRAGGRVVALVGNHEAMNMTDDLRYVSAGEYAAFATRKSAQVRDRAFAANRTEIEASYRRRDPNMGVDAIRAAWIAATPLGQVEHQTAWHPGGWIGRWVAGNPAIALVDGTLFVHGGLDAAHAARPIDDINRQVAAALRSGDGAPTSILYDETGPLWYRGLAAPPTPQIGDELGRVLSATGARRMVIAHTPDLAGIQLLYDGRLARIDTGISAYYGGKPSYLEIVDGRFVPHEVARTARQ